MRARQGEIHTARVSNRAPILTLERMSTSQRIINVSSRAILIRRPIESNNSSQASVSVTAVTFPVPDVVNAIPDVLVVAGESVLEVDVERLRWSVAPWLVVWHAGVADWDHGAVAGRWFAPAVSAEAAFGVFVGFVVDAVQAVRAVVPLEIAHCPGRDWAAGWWSDGARQKRCGDGGCGQGQQAGQDSLESHRVG